MTPFLGCKITNLGLEIDCCKGHKMEVRGRNRTGITALPEHLIIAVSVRDGRIIRALPLSYAHHMKMAEQAGI